MVSRPVDLCLNDIRRSHMRWGWTCLLVFLCFGICLEILHGLKIQWYLSVEHTARRHLWTLAHAHGTLLSVVNIVFGLSVPYLWSNAEPSRWVSRCFKSAGSLLPLGFFLGGVRFYSGDPGLGIALVPIGGAALLYATIQTVHSVWKRQPSEDDPKALERN